MFGKALVWIIVPQNCTEYIFRQYTKMLFHLEEGIFMKTGKAPCRILAMALAVTVFATSTSLTTLAEKGEGYDGTGAVQTLSEAMPEMDYGSPTSEISSESQTESSAEIIGGGGETPLMRIRL